jgi:hypothetical protein
MRPGRCDGGDCRAKPDARYIDPLAEAEGRDAIEATIAAVQQQLGVDRVLPELTAPDVFDPRDKQWHRGDDWRWPRDHDGKDARG